VAAGVALLSYVAGACFCHLEMNRR